MIYISASQCIIRINIIILLLPFLGFFPLINQFSSIRLDWVSLHTDEIDRCCSSEGAIWWVQTMRPLSSDLWKAGFVLVVYTLVDVLQGGA